LGLGVLVCPHSPPGYGLGIQGMDISNNENTVNQQVIGEHMGTIRKVLNFVWSKIKFVGKLFHRYFWASEDEPTVTKKCCSLSQAKSNEEIIKIITKIRLRKKLKSVKKNKRK